MSHWLWKRFVCLVKGHHWACQWVDYPWIENIGPCRRCGYQSEACLDEEELASRERLAQSNDECDDVIGELETALQNRFLSEKSQWSIDCFYCGPELSCDPLVDSLLIAAKAGMCMRSRKVHEALSKHIHDKFGTPIDEYSEPEWQTQAYDQFISTIERLIQSKEEGSTNGLE